MTEVVAEGLRSLNDVFVFSGFGDPWGGWPAQGKIHCWREDGLGCKELKQNEYNSWLIQWRKEWRMVKTKHEEESGVDLCCLELSSDRRGNCWLCETPLGVRRLRCPPRPYSHDDD